MLHVGVWPLIMGMTMWVQMQLNPQQPDPVQQKIFNWMPVIFTFMLASFPSGLVIYWAWNNVLSLLQQYTIMRKNNTEVHLWKNLGADKWKARLAGGEGARRRARSRGTSPARRASCRNPSSKALKRDDGKGANDNKTVGAARAANEARRDADDARAGAARAGPGAGRDREGDRCSPGRSRS